MACFLCYAAPASQDYNFDTRMLTPTVVHFFRRRQHFYAGAAVCDLMCCPIAALQSAIKTSCSAGHPTDVRSNLLASMTLPGKNIASVGPLLGLLLIGWIVEVFGLYFLQKSCHKHATPAWAASAGFPAVGTCWKMYRFEWATILFELVIVLGLMFTVTSGSLYKHSETDCLFVSSLVCVVCRSSLTSQRPWSCRKGKTFTVRISLAACFAMPAARLVDLY